MPRIVLTLEKQRNTNWCWAAVSLAVLDHYRNHRHDFPTSQQALADEFVSGENKQFDIFDVLARYEVSHGTAVAFQVGGVKASIDASQPVVLQTGSQGNAHFVLIVGYANPTGMGVEYEILDPNQPETPLLKKKEEIGKIVGLQYTKAPPIPQRASRKSCPCPCVIM